ncbi:MAG TPA: endopeptidase La [Acidimicrobiales bacterium]|nr:endopeptidase La [Acidimicrobiales bacterium]
MPDTVTRSLPVLPLTAGVVGPGMVVTILIDSAEAKAAMAAATEHAGRRLLLVPHVQGRYATVGTVAAVEDANGRAVVVRGVERAVLGSATEGHADALCLAYEPVAEAEAPTEETRALAREYRALVERILDKRGAGRLTEAVRGVRDPSQVADLALWSPDIDLTDKVRILETLDVPDRLRLVIALGRDALAELEVGEDIDREVAEGLDKQQREQLLRRRMEAIRNELGEGDGDDVASYRARLAASGAPSTVRDAVAREIDRLERMSTQSPEHSWIATWLDTVLDVPWSTRAEESFELDAVRRVLDADHAGLHDVKDRIVESLAVRKLRAERAVELAGRGTGTILALVGPPGVGKTSLGESVARALGRPFARVALGGVRDEAEIRGHRRTYVGARAGRFVRAITEAGAMNPVLLLDEIDKVGSDWRGDPSSALLEVLDPAQNHTFRDHYLEVDLDLSDVVFIATANTLDTIPAPLLDRMEVVSLDGYTHDEKAAIARDHVLPRLVHRTGLRADEVEVTDEAIASIVGGYTREAGVRELERQLGRVLRKVAARVADGDATVVVDADAVRELLGRPRFRDEVRVRTSVPGVATGLAVTGVGGDVLFVEATSMDGEPGLTLTGQLGDVMKESAEIARSYVRSHAAALGIDAEVLQRRVHVHVPAGAVPKDGPSAGVTMTTALVSLLAGRPVKESVGMTGEVTLQGLVLPIGGVKQKVLAAHRAGLTEVVLPAGNDGDLDDVPEKVREAMTFHLATTVDDVLAVAFA